MADAREDSPQSESDENEKALDYKIIEEVKKCKVLWDLTSKEYLNRQKKNNAWKFVAELLGLTTGRHTQFLFIHY